MTERRASASFEPVEIYVRTRVAVRNYSIEWVIENFSFCNKLPGEFISSPIFVTGNDQQLKWKIELYPNGDHTENNDHVSVFIKPLTEKHVSTKLRFYILNRMKEKCDEHAGIKMFCGETAGFRQFVRRDFLFNKDNALLDGDNLTIVCDFQVAEEVLESSVNYNLDSDINKLTADLNELLKSAELSDVTISVGEKNFKVHKTVLAARSPVFSAMFKHQLEETKSNIVRICDVEPNVMEEVLRFIYSGKSPKIRELAEEMLPVADRYHLDSLKALIEKVLTNQLTIDKAAAILILADLYNAANLKENTIDYICTNARDVLMNCCWKRLKTSHPNLLLEVYTAIIDRKIIVNQTQEVKTSAKQ